MHELLRHALDLAALLAAACLVVGVLGLLCALIIGLAAGIRSWLRGNR